MTRVVPTEEELQGLVGRALPGGTFTVEPWRAWLTHDAILAPQDDNVLHPLFAYLAATGAMGISWDGLFEWLGTSASDGPMFGDCELAYYQAMRVEGTYVISGTIESVQRKEGRRAGVFDLVGYGLRVEDEDGDPVATCRNSLVIPRRA